MMKKTTLCALSLICAQMQAMQEEFLYPALVSAGISAAYLGSRLCSNGYLNKYSLTYTKTESKRQEGVEAPGIIFDNIKLKKGGDEFDFSGTIWEYNTNPDAVGQVIRSGLVDHVAPLLRKGNHVLVKLSNVKTAHFIGKSHTEKEIMNGILEVLLRIEDETHIKYFK